MNSFLRLVLLSLSLLAAAPPLAAQATAVQISSSGQLIPGVTADGQIGDYLLSNPQVRVVIDAIDHPHGFANTGGNIIDAADASGEDRFASMFTMFDNHFGRQANYATLTIINPGGGGQTAHIRCVGVDSENPEVAVATDYTLAPGDRFVTVVTTLTNNGKSDIQQLQVGDAVQWGLTTHFAPGWANLNRNVLGDGYDIGGKTLDCPWVAGDGQGSAYGVGRPAGNPLIEMSNGSTWSDTNFLYLDLPAGGGAGAYERYFIVGTGSIASVSDEAFRLSATSTGTIAGTVVENVTGNPVEGATVVINTGACLGSSSSKSYTIARTSASGAYSANLEPGTYYVLFKAVGRTTTACQSVAVTAGNTTTLDRTMSRPGTLSWDVRDALGAPLPAKISVLYSPLTAKWEGPTLGDSRSLIGGYAILSGSGSGSTIVPPGTYQVWATRGVEYEPVVQTLTVAEAGTASFNAVLQKVVDTAGYVSGDMHVHGAGSADSAVAWEDRAVQSAAEGLEIVVVTDHDYISEMNTAIASTGMGAFVNSYSGNEVTTNTWGHHNGYPLTRDFGAPRNGALDHAGLSPQQIFSALRSDPKDPVVQVNHPRAGGLGYFDLCALNPVTAEPGDPAYSGDFDAVEVVNGKRLYQVAQVLNDWYNLLNAGHLLVAVGNTDTHQIFSQEIGYPRNFVHTGTDDPATVTEGAFREGVRSGRVVLTNGPFVETWLNGQPMGALVSAPSGAVTLRVRIQAPAWMTVDTLHIIVNGETVQTVTITPATGTVVRLDQTYPLTLSRDAWVAVEVKGGQCETDASNACITPGCPGRLDPLLPPMYGTDPVCPYAHTNAHYADFNDNGIFDAPGNAGLRVEPISQIRPVDANYQYTRLDEVVTVRGTVTAGSWTFDHRSNTIYFQDDSIDTVNKRSGGATIYQYGLIKPELYLGDYIQATGTITDYNGLLELSGVSIELLDENRPVPEPSLRTVYDLWTWANADQWEGMLVRVNNLTITGGTWPTYGNTANITVNDGSNYMTLRIDSDTDIDGTPAPVGTFDVVAVLGQYDPASPYRDGYQLLPRQRIDIIESGDPNRILHGPAVWPVTACSATVTWYTTKPGTSVVDYGTTPAYGLQAAGASGVNQHVVPLSGLSAGTLYHYRVTTDGIVSEDFTFTTASGAVPQATYGPVVQFVDAATVQIVWDTDLASTSTVRYGTSTAYGATVTGPSGTRHHYATLSGLSLGTTYHFQVESVSAACGGGTLLSADHQFNTPLPVSSPPEVSPRGAGIPFTLAKTGGGLVVRADYKGSAYRYHLYGASGKAAIEAGAYGVKVCDLKNNAEGTWATDDATFIQWTIADPAQIPDGFYRVVAEAGGLEGPYGYASDGSFAGRDSDGTAPTAIGCGAIVCAGVSASIVNVDPDTTVLLGTGQTFTGTGSGEGSLAYEWDFHYDGSFTAEGSGASVAYTYPSAGSYTAALRVTDSCPGGAQTALDTVPVTVQAGSACDPLVVVSRVYGGGGNSGAYWKRDYIELHNRGGSSQDLTGWSVQYASATGTTWQVTNLSGTIPSGGYYLVWEAQGSGGTADLPSADATGSIAMSGTAGKVALVASQTALSGACPTGTQIKDLVGFGTTANCYEGAGPAPAPSNTTADDRKVTGCTDTNNNGSDFQTVPQTVAEPNPPRNSASTPVSCTCP
jgi:hypothetical protein